MLNSSSFRESFVNRRYGAPGSINVSIMKFVARKNDVTVKKFCFVEGYSDIVFYKGALPKELGLRPNEIFFIINQDLYSSDSDGALLGKRSVIKICEYILSEHKNKLDQCKFIVDQDYDGLDLSKHQVSVDVIPYITVLPCYSFENYYFIDNNLKSIMKIVFGSIYIIYYNEFLEILTKFLTETSEYNAIKKIVVKYSLHQKFKEKLFHFLNFKDEDCDCLVDDNEKIKLDVKPFQCAAKEAIAIFSCLPDNESKLLYFVYDQYRLEMEKDPLIVKGKLLFNLLLQYINLNSKEPYNYNDLHRYSNQLICPGLN